MRLGGLFAATLVLAGGLASPAFPQSRPLPIETLAGAGAGNVSLEVGTDYTRAAQFTLSGLQGDLWRLGLIRIDVGLSSVADLEITGGLRDRLRITSKTPAVFSDKLELTDPASTSAFDDIVVATKVRLLDEAGGAPGLAIHVATRLPNAKHPSGLGQNTTDFYGTLIAAESVSATEITGNVGLGILGDPLRGNRRVDSLLYGVALSRPVTANVACEVGVDGRTGPLEPGLEPRALGKVGAVWKHGRTRVALDATLGLTSRDGNIGGAVTAGFTFHGFNP